LIKYIKSVLWRVSKCLSYIEEARCLKVKGNVSFVPPTMINTLPYLMLQTDSVQNTSRGQRHILPYIYVIATSV